MNLLISLRSEILKTKRTSSWYLTMVVAAVLPVLLLLDACIDGLNPETLRDPVNVMVRESFKGLNLLILPMYIILICTLLPQLEYRNNTWKQVFSSPQTLAAIFFSKFLNMQLLILLFLLLYNVCMGVMVLVVDLTRPAIGMFSKGMDWTSLRNFNVKTYICVAALSAVQFLLGLRIRNFIAPIAIGFVLWVIGGILVFESHSPIANGFPFSYPHMVMFENFRPLVPGMLWASAGYVVLLLSAGYWLFTTMKVKV